MVPETQGSGQNRKGSRDHKYSLQEVASGVYLITDTNYHNVFTTTSDGVVLFDAPTPLVGFIEPAIREVTDDPVTHLVYTHVHNDHIGGASQFVTPDTKIYAGAGTAEFLQARQDPTRPVPTHIFSEDTTLTIGGRTFEIAPDRFHTVTGDLLINMPREKVVVAIDTLGPEWMPILDFSITADMYGYMKIFDRILGLDFDVLVGGHDEHVARRSDVELTREYVHDVYQTVKRVHSELDTSWIYAEERGDEQRLALELFSSVWVDAGKEIAERWKDSPVQGAELWAESHCRAMFLYVNWTD
jgi:glyoxylase-like metal-dependent hydrolase (beta-lactamase superfamily II)